MNFQVPAQLAAGQNAIEVHVGGQRVARGVITTVGRSPGLFVSTDQSGRINRGRRGEFLTVYGSGQGSVAPEIADGAVAAASPLSSTPVSPSVFIDGRRATVNFSGLAPGFVGLWQINAQVPQEVTAGEVELIVLYDSNLASNALKVTVE